MDTVLAEPTVAASAPATLSSRHSTYLAFSVGALVMLVFRAFAMLNYGYFRDELYYLASTQYVSLGYVEHPPLFIYLLAVQTALFGDSLFALRILPALAALWTMLLIVFTVREMGGGLWAQVMVALSVAVMPIYLAIPQVYSMNAFDQLFGALAAFVLARLVRTGETRYWLLLGLVLGLGLENKISMLWICAGVAAGLLLTQQRIWLRTRWPYLAAGIALVIFLPFVLWQAYHHFPLLEFMHNATSRKMVPTTPLTFFMEQFGAMNPVSALLFFAGAVGLVAMSALRPWRIHGIVFATVMVILLVSGTAKDYYLGPTYPFLLAPGAIAAGVLFARGAWRFVGYAFIALTLIIGTAISPFAIPVLSEATYISYARALGFSPPQQERLRPSELPQFYADMHGWQEMADSVARVYRSLSPEEQAHCAIYGQNYGEAGAIDVLGRRLGLPQAMSGHNSYWIWGPAKNCRIVIVIGGNAEDHRQSFESVEQVSITNARYAMPYENQRPIFLCRKLKKPIEEVWGETKEFI